MRRIFGPVCVYTAFGIRIGHCTVRPLMGQARSREVPSTKGAEGGHTPKPKTNTRRRTASSTQRSSEAASSEAASVRHSGRWETRTPTMCEKARLLCFPPVCILELELVTAKRSVENSQPFDGWPYAA